MLGVARQGLLWGFRKRVEIGVGHVRVPQVAGDDPYLDLRGDYEGVCLKILKL